LIADTEDGTLIRENISQLERLIGAYEEGILAERGQ
jgi:hypothetical protein